MNELGGLNYDALLGSQDYTFYRNLLETQLLTRFLIQSGYPAQPVQTGIVDLLNPAQISSSEVSRPFLITVSNVAPLNLQINPGMAITQTGTFTQLTTQLTNFPLASTAPNAVNVIFIANQLQDQGENLANDYQEDIYSQQGQIPNNIQCALLSDYQSGIGNYTPQNLKDFVVLAVVTVVPITGGGLQLSVDMSQSVYAFNRPWYSVLDLQHRSYLGSGTVTPQNAHALSFNDLTPAGTVGIFQGLMCTGAIVSRDLAINKMIGALYCQESIPYARIQTDSSGLITAGSVYGGVGAQYVSLSNYPTRMGSVYNAITPSAAISAELVPQTNILVFGPDEVFDSSMTLTAEYTETTSLLPPVNPPTNLLTFGQPQAGEVVVSGGYTFAALPNPSIDLDGLGPFSRVYDVYFLQNGNLVTYPQTILPASTIVSLGTGQITPSQPMVGTARIRVGLTLAGSASDLSVSVYLSGTDSLGNAQSETLVLSTANGYVDQGVPNTNYESAAQIYTSQFVYGSVSYIQLPNGTTLDANPQATIQVWADIEPGTSASIDDSAQVIRAYWNGQGIAQIFDRRVISRGYSIPNLSTLRSTGEIGLDAGRILSSLQASPLLNQTSLLLFSEDFEDLKHFDSARGFVGPTYGTGVLSLNPVVPFTAGDTVTLLPGKVLTATTGTPNPAVGQFQMGGSLTTQQVLANVVATINNGTFDSGVTAVADPTVSTNIDLTLNEIPGTPGNTHTITTSLTNPSSLSVTGFNFAYDGFGECYMERSVNGVLSPFVPANGNLDPYVYTYRKRYRCRAVGLPFGLTAQKNFAVEVHQQNKYAGASVRMRAAYPTNPQVWGPWQVLSAEPHGLLGLYLANFSNPVFKVQVEVYGSARGVSVYNLVPNT